MIQKKKRSQGISKSITGLGLGLLGFVLPQLVHFGGLSAAGHIALGIFLMAAVFWIFETIPIYSTSLLVIFLQVVLLSHQGPYFSGTDLPQTQPVAADNGHWMVPANAIRDNKVMVLTEKGEQELIPAQIVEHGKMVKVSAQGLTTETTIVADQGHRLVGYKPVSYSVFFATLASPIIILFLGGFMLARAAVKYNLDKNLTNILLRPFGEKPVYILLGLMLVTATLSAFMSNTATTAMMMTVAIPIAMQVDKKDKFRIMLALCIPVAANIGGMATPIGTPPNAIVIANLQQQGINIAFGTWISLMLPLTLLLLFVAWFSMQLLFPPVVKKFSMILTGSFDRSWNARILYVIFGITVLLWITEASHGIPSAMIAFLPIAGLTVTSVLKQDDIRSLPWEVLWLVAGGIALGISMENTGLAGWLVSGIAWDTLPQVILLLVFGLVAIMLSNFLSNTVTATLLIPLAVSLGVSGVAGEGFSLVITSLLIGAACNMAMLLPISTPPNAIAMSTGFLKTGDMIRIGIVVGITGIIGALAFALFYWPLFTN
jgi:solute carrier family 13 (sodium-dependent dicarboxylate transporter), member 2/3/5